jgi:hypothetical protein
MGLSEQLRESIVQSGRTLYRISKDSGVSYSSLHYFVRGAQGLSAESLEKLVGYFGWTIGPPQQKRAAKTRK